MIGLIYDVKVKSDAVRNTTTTLGYGSFGQGGQGKGTVPESRVKMTGN